MSALAYAELTVATAGVVCPSERGDPMSRCTERKVASRSSVPTSAPHTAIGAFVGQPEKCPHQRQNLVGLVVMQPVPRAGNGLAARLLEIARQSSALALGRKLSSAPSNSVGQVMRAQSET